MFVLLYLLYLYYAYFLDFQIKDMLEPYLDIQNLSTPQQALSSFGTSDR